MSASSPVRRPRSMAVGAVSLVVGLVAALVVGVGGASSAHAVSSLGAPTPSPAVYTVTIAGQPVVGRTLSASALPPEVTTRRCSCDVVTTWQWSRGGTAIPGATGSTYAVSPADLGSRLTAAISVVGDTPLEGAGSATTAVVTVPALTLATNKKRVRQGQRFRITIGNLLPGEDWTLSFRRERLVLARGAAPSGTTLRSVTRVVRLPRHLKHRGGVRHLLVTTTAPNRTGHRDIVVPH